MKIGKLRTPLLLQTAKVQGEGPSWQTLAALWGALTPAAEVSPAAEGRKVSHHVVVRYRADLEVAPGQRLCAGERNFLIRAVTNLDEANRWLKLFVEEQGYLN